MSNTPNWDYHPGNALSYMPQSVSQHLTDMETQHLLQADAERKKQEKVVRLNNMYHIGNLLSGQAAPLHYPPLEPPMSLHLSDSIDANSQAVRMWNTERQQAQRDLESHMRALHTINNDGYEAALATHTKRTQMLRRNLTRAILNCEIADAQYFIERETATIENSKKNIVAHHKAIAANRKKLAALR